MYFGFSFGPSPLARCIAMEAPVDVIGPLNAEFVEGSGYSLRQQNKMHDD